MHELAITQSILRIALEEAARHNAKRILSIDIKRGVYSGVMPEYVQEYFNIVSRGTPAENAVLHVERVPATVRCNSCGGEGRIDIHEYRCPLCGGTDVKLISGTEFYMSALEAE